MMVFVRGHDEECRLEVDALHIAAQIAAALAERPDIAVLALLHALDLFGAVQTTGLKQIPATIN